MSRLVRKPYKLIEVDWAGRERICSFQTEAARTEAILTVFCRARGIRSARVTTSVPWERP